MRSEGARAPVWGSLAATMDDEARTIVLESGSQVGEILACLELIAAVAEETLPDVTTAARARVAAARSEAGSRPVRLPPFPEAAKRYLALILHTAGDVASQLGQGAVAESAARLAGDLYIELEGPVSRDYLVSLASLSNVYARAGLYQEAETSAAIALGIAAKLEADDRPVGAADSAGLFLTLGAAHARRGRLSEAAESYRQACVLLEPLQDERASFAVAVNNLGATELRLGRVAEALGLLSEALRIRRELLKPDDPSVAETLMNLGVLAQSLRRWTIAGTYFTEALAVRQAAWPDIDHPLTAQSLSSVAVYEHALGETDTALARAQEALDMRRRLFDVPHPDLAESLSNVAHMHAVAGELATAVGLWTEAIDVLIAAVGYDAPDLPTTFDNLALAQAALGQLHQARPAAKAAVQIAERALGDNHPHLANYLSTQALMHALSRQRSEALASLRRAVIVEESAYWSVVRMSSARGRAAYASGKRDLADGVLTITLLSGQDPTEAELVEAAGLVLRRKRVELEIRLALRRALKSNRDPRVSAAAAMLAEARTELVRLELGGPRGSTIAEHQRRLLEAGLAIEQSETELAELLPDLNLAATLQSFTVSGVAGALPVGAVLVDIVRIDEINLDPGGQRYVRNVARERYVALVLRAGSRKVALVPLADACVIDQMVHDFRAAIISGDSEIGVGVALHGELIAPLMPHVGDARTVYLAPDADLFELPFDAVPLEDGRRLADLWQITYLTSGRELLLEGNLAPEATARPALVVGDPDFDMGSHLPVEVPPVFASAGLSFERLDYTRGEAEQVATALGVVPLLGPGATESAVKATHSPHVLHLATHGFFLPVPPHTDLASGPDPDTWMSTDPLLRSGLLLAGSRTWCRGGDSGDAEDGLLTAEDVVQMDLRGTRLVVLSACESGRGIVESGEGMQGLRSAFQIAGASWVVMSLWQVGDEITAELMESFYAAFTAGQEPSSALASAQAQIRRRRPNQPFAWAAFICQGPRA